MSPTPTASSSTTSAQPPVALITGAGTGIGRTTAIFLAQAGYNLALNSRTLANLEQTKSLCLQANPKSKILLLTQDISFHDACQQVVAQTLATFSRVDLLLHSAGIAPICPIEKISPEIWLPTLNTNLSAAIYLTSALWPTFKKQPASLIINISSMAAIDPFPGFALYAPTKIALNMFTHFIAQEGKPHNIRSVAICPGAVETPLLRSAFDTNILPPSKTLSPETVASLILDCITGKRAFSSGQAIQLPSP